MVDSQLGIIPMKSKSNKPKGLGGDSIFKQIIYVVLLLALMAILFLERNSFSCFERSLSNIPRLGGLNEIGPGV